MGIVAGLLAMLFWGTSIFLAAKTSRRIGNKLALFWMQVFGFVIGSAYFLVFKPSFNSSILYKHLPVLVVIAILQLIASLSFYSGLSKGKVSLVSPISASWGLVVAVLGVILLGENLSWKKIFAIVVIISGIVLLSFDFKNHSKSISLQSLVGVKEGLIAMFGWGISLFLLGIPTKDLDWFLPAYLFRLILILFLGGYIYFAKEQFITNKKQFPLNQLITIGALDLFAFISFSYGLSIENSSLVAPIASACTLVSVVLAWIFLKERLNKHQIAGIVGIVVGLIFISF